MSTRVAEELMASTGALKPVPLFRVASAAGVQCGAYQLVAPLGAGGMGVVWRARRTDGRFVGEVAVKLLGAALTEPNAVRRFRREGEILARLQHPNIRALLDAGVTDDGQPFLVLELVEGMPIDEWVRVHHPDVPSIVRLVMQVLEAIAHAHTRLVVHRDLKPSNILVDRAGRVRLLDFGIAKLLDADGNPAAPRLTLAGDGPLTPRYAAPEQLTNGDVSTATDVYSAGVLLCELLTGALPYRTARDTLGALEAAIVSDAPVPPSELVSSPQLRRRLRGDLDTIVLTALAKNPLERYASVAALADDLQRWLDDRAIKAQAATAGVRVSRFLRRHALAVGTATLVLLSLVGGGLAALQQASVARAEQRRAETTTAFVSQIFTDADPSEGDGTALSGRELLLQAYARLDEAFGDRPDQRLDLQLLVAQGLVKLQAYDAAEPVLQELRELAVAAHGEADLRAIRADLLASAMHRYRGDLEAMRVTTTRALVSIRRAGAKDSALLVEALNDSVTLAIASGRAPEARAMSGVVLALARRTLSAGDPQLVAAAQNHVITLQRTKAAPDSLREAAAFALSVTKQAHGIVNGHPAVITSMIVHAAALDADGRTRDAIAELDRAVALERAARPDMPLGRAFALGNAATYRRAIGEFEAALADFDSSAVAFQALGDTTGPNYAITLSNRGETLRLLDRLDAAEVDFAQARTLVGRQWGDTHELAVLIRLRQSMIRTDQGSVREAALLLQEIDDASLAARRPLDYAQARAQLARRMGQVDDALSAVEVGLRAMPAWRNATTERDRAPLLAHRALTLVEAGRDVDARPAIAEALEAYRAAGISRGTLLEAVERAARRLAVALPEAAP